MGHPLPHKDVGRVMASCTLRTHLKGRLSINLVLAVILLLDGENFLVRGRCFQIRSRHATEGDALLLSFEFPSKQV